MVSNAASIPRVVRASNLGDIKFVGWLAGLGCPAMLASIVYLAAHPGMKPEGFVGIIVMLGVSIVPVFCVFIPILTLFLTGTWIADDRGIEFIPYAPRLRKWKFLTWSEIERVKWARNSAVLDAADGERMTLIWSHLPKPDQRPLRAKVEASLGHDFDLASPLPARRARPARAGWRSELRGIARLAGLTVLLSAPVVPGYIYALKHPERRDAP